jgi:hypothetical protein
MCRGQSTPALEPPVAEHRTRVPRSARDHSGPRARAKVNEREPVAKRVLRALHACAQKHKKLRLPQTASLFVSALAQQGSAVQAGH